MAEIPVKQQRRYLAYLLRLWQESPGEPLLWRASLERPQAGERLGFASLVDLFDYLAKETGTSPTGSQRLAENGCQPPGMPE